MAESESEHKRRKLDGLGTGLSESEADIEQTADQGSVEVEVASEIQESSKTSKEDNISAIVTRTNDVSEPQSTNYEEIYYKDGIPIPKNSALLEETELPSITFEMPPDMLIKTNLASLTLSLQSSEILPIRTQFLINSVPLLDNVATQILRLIGVGPYEETLSIITSEESSPQTLVYRDLVDLFEQVKRIYSEEDPFLNMEHFFNNFNNELLDGESLKSLKAFEGPVDLALRKANLATFLLSTLGSIEVGFFFLNESFLDVFCPVYVDYFEKFNSTAANANHSENNSDGKKYSVTYHPKVGKLLKVQAGLFLELKTQAYISALEAGDRSKEEILEDIFPSDLMDQLLKRRNSTQLSPSELDFISRCRSRKDTLFNTENDEDLSESYDWLIFLKELFSYVSKNISVLIWGKKNRTSYLTPLQNIDSIINNKHPYSDLTKEELQLKLQQQRKKEEDLMKERELQEREKPEKTTKRAKSSKSTKSSSTAASTSQTATSSASAQQGPPRIRNMLRRPWSTAEENALVDALKEVGPYWSKILEHYGPGGSTSEALKNRTQVQLKDKSRNWKMAYLKNGAPVPDYLAKVTGVIERDDRQVNARKKQRQKLEEQRNRLGGSTKKKKDDKDKDSETETNKASNSDTSRPEVTSSENDEPVAEENIDKTLIEQSKIAEESDLVTNDTPEQVK